MCGYALEKQKVPRNRAALSREQLKTQHLPIGYHAAFNIVTRNLLHPLQTKAFDVETRDQDPIRHSRLECHGIEVVLLGEVTHHTAGKAVSGAGGVDYLLRGKRGH